MAEWVMGLISILLCLFEGYCIQSFFCSFAVPKLCRIRNEGWAAGIAWVVIRAVSEGLFSDTDNASLILELLFIFCTLFAFCVCWYQGNILLKIFLAVQFISLRELSFWTGYSLIYIGNEMIEVLVHKAGTGMASVEYLPVAAGILSCFGIALVGAARCALLFVSTRKIAGSYCGKQKGRMGKEVVFYLLPSVAGTLVSALVLLGAVVFSFCIYQDVVGLQEERAEKIVLENQITQMQEKQPDAEAYITIRSFLAKNMYFIEIENSFDGLALFRGDRGFPISTKEDKEVHGIGLKNIRKCAVKYGGDLDCIVKGNKFTLSVMVKS